MVFSSSEFLLFFLPIVLILYSISENLHYKNVILLLASLIFYAWGEPKNIFLIIALVFANWLVGLCIGRASEKRKKKLLLTAGVVIDVGVLFVFKYLTFVCDAVGQLIDKDSKISIALPIGISFFTFQIMSYLFDVYYGNTKEQKNILKLALYITMFPQLIAGPIVRYQTVADEISSRKTTTQDFTNGIFRFVIGLSKKVIIANHVASIADNIFALGTDEMSVMTAWLGAIAYTLQIYYDFSGYSDMAIGLGLVFGFHFEENFNYPYAASSVTDFWRRWHISLSVWFRDYVYIPMGGNRVKKSRWIFNLLIVWLLTGIWHGADWTFLIWGLLYFAVQLIEKLTGFTKKIKRFSHIYTLLVVVLLWVIFRADSLSAALAYIGAMFGGGYRFADNTFIFYLKSGLLILISGAVFALPIVPKIKSAAKKIKNNKAVSRIYSIASPIIILVLFVSDIILSVNSTYNPFIYFNF